MPRIVIDLPEHWPFSTEIRLRVTDMNYGNHLGNDALLGILHEARCRFLQNLGYTEMNLEGLGIIMTDSAIVYKSEAFTGDILQINVAAGDFNKYGFDLYYKVWNVSQNKLTAEAKTGICTFNYQSKKLASLPEAARARLNQLI
jgi:acyl-CoA thioesterase FadM